MNSAFWTTLIPKSLWGGGHRWRGLWAKSDVLREDLLLALGEGDPHGGPQIKHWLLVCNLSTPPTVLTLQPSQEYFYVIFWFWAKCSGLTLVLCSRITPVRAQGSFVVLGIKPGRLHAKCNIFVQPFRVLLKQVSVLECGNMGELEEGALPYW